MHSQTLTSQCHHNHSLANDSHVQCGRTVAGVCVSRETVWQNGGSRVWRLCGQSAVLGGSSSSQVQHGESVARLCSRKGETRESRILTFSPLSVLVPPHFVSFLPLTFSPSFALFLPSCFAFPAYRLCHNHTTLRSYFCHALCDVPMHHCIGLWVPGLREAHSRIFFLTLGSARVRGKNWASYLARSFALACDAPIAFQRHITKPD